LDDRGPQPDERDVIEALMTLAGESRVYRLHVESARPMVERLVTDVDDVEVGALLTSVVTALSNQLGTPRHVEQLALRVLHELRQWA
jgi:hypothetical protein